MEPAFLIGRIIAGVYFITMGLNHFAQRDMMNRWAAAKSVPSPEAAVIISGLLLWIGGLSFLSGLFPTVGAAALASFLVPVTLFMHPFWREKDPNAQVIEMTNFAKNLGLLGLVLMTLLIPQPWPYTLSR